MFQACNPAWSYCFDSNDGKFFIAQYDTLYSEVTSISSNMNSDSFAIASSLTSYELNALGGETSALDKIYVGGNVKEGDYYEAGIFVLSADSNQIEQISIQKIE